MKTFRDWMDLIESPQLIDPTEFNLNDPDANRRIADDIMGKKSLEVLWQDDDHIMGKTGKNDSGYFALYNKKTKLVDYVVKYETQRYKFIGKYATQVAIWRNALDLSTRNLSTKMFFEYLLTMHGIIVSDRQQTEAGQRFWVLRIGDAIDRGLKVGLIDAQSKTVDWYDGSGNQWLSDRMKYWTKEPRSSFYRFIIAEPSAI